MGEDDKAEHWDGSQVTWILAPGGYFLPLDTSHSLGLSFLPGQGQSLKLEVF